MSQTLPQQLRRQLARVSRRLFVQTLLDSLAWCWAAALVVALVWFLAEPLLMQSPPHWLRWTVAGAAAGVGAILAVVLAIVWAPTRLAAALALDERFGLKERVTTTLTLPAGLEQTPAGQALIEDVGKHVAKLDVGERFPVRLSWTAGLVPLMGGVLAMVALFYEPPLGRATVDPAAEGKKAPVNAIDIEKKIDALVKKPQETKPAEKGEKSKEMERIEAELRELVNKPRQTKDDVRERAKELNDAESNLKAHQKQLAEKAQALKAQLKNIDKLNQGDKEGPAKRLEKALKDGDFDKAKDEAERLAKKLANNELNNAEKEELKKQIDALKERLDQLSRQQDEEDRLKELARRGEIDKETLDRELDRLKKDSQDLKELQDIAESLEQCKQCMGKGDGEGASRALRRAADRLREMDGRDAELDDIREKLDAISQCKQCMGQCLGDNPVPGAGRRPETKEGGHRSNPSRVRVDFDQKGQKEIVDFVPGRSFKKKSSAEVAGEVKQASQEAPEALERQRIPRAASDMARGYYEKLREQAEKEQKAGDR